MASEAAHLQPCLCMCVHGCVCVCEGREGGRVGERERERERGRGGVAIGSEAMQKREGIESENETGVNIGL